MKFAILGGGSCFAMNLALHLTGRGYEVLSISRSPMRETPFTLGLENKSNFRYRVAHLLLQQDIAFRYLDEFKPEVIINFAALCEVGLSWVNAEDYYQTNVISMVRMCEGLKQRDWLRRFVQVGSSEVYGSVETGAKEDSPIRPSSPYAVSKSAFDMHLEAIAKHQGFPAVIVRPSNGYCEGQPLNRIMPKTIISSINGTKLQLQGGGMARKSYIHGDDISSAIRLISTKKEVSGIYNCGPEESTSIREIVETLAAMMGKKLEDVCEISEERKGQDAQYLLDSSRIRALGWKPEVSMHQGYARMIYWVRKYPELLAMRTDYEHRQ